MRKGIKHFTFILSLLLMVVLCSATGDYIFINSIAFTQPVKLTTDNLGNAYVIVENQVLQFDRSGKPLTNYSQSNFGMLKSVDATNPMKIFLFYPDFAKIIILDNKLAEQSIIDLRPAGIRQPLAACNSAESGYWIYDREDDQLKKIDLNLQVISESGNLSQLTGYHVKPAMMTEDNGFVYMNNPETGILVFDRYGSYYKTMPFKNIHSFQVIGSDLLFINNSRLFRYDSRSLSEKEVLIPSKDSVRAARIEQHQLYLLTSDSLNFYSF